MRDHQTDDGVRRPAVDWIALVGIVVTVTLHLVLQARRPSPAFIVGACIFWGGFVVVRAVRRPGVLRDWGFRADHLLASAVVPALLFCVGAAALGIWAWFQGTLGLPLYALPLFALYPAWGLAQQFLTLGVAVQNLERIPELRQRRWLLVLLGAALFGAVHAPDWWVVAATFWLELCLVPVFLRFRNLWPLGVVHGWLGLLYYYWGLGRDMMAEGFGW